MVCINTAITENESGAAVLENGALLEGDKQTAPQGELFRLPFFFLSDGVALLLHSEKKRLSYQTITMCKYTKVV